MNKQEAIATSVLKEGDISQFDPFTILFIIGTIIQILQFLGPFWKNPEKLPVWKKLAIKTKLFWKFGRAKGLKMEQIIYSKIASLNEEEVKGFAQIHQG